MGWPESRVVGQREGASIRVTPYQAIGCTDETTANSRK